ncbi:MAG TPA: 6-phosphogluconolactonase [Gemmatimonadales bacterium]
MKPYPERLVIEPADLLAASAGEWILRGLANAMRERVRASLGLSGGHTPRATYEWLAEHGGRVPWDRVEVFFADERCVPPDDPESNYRLVRETLLDRASIPPENVHRMACEEGDRDAAARRYAALVPEHFDVLLLGMGADGHTASLFPGARELDEQTKDVLPSTSPEAPHERLTITPRVIAAARDVAVLVTGEAKAEMVRRALEGDYRPRELPIQLALAATWFLDREAASMLSSRADAP